MAAPRVLLADDHALLLGALERLLVSECEVVGQVGDGRALVDAAKRLKPDVIVLDVMMPHLNGLEAARRIKDELPDVKLIFATMNEDADLAAEAFRCGASGYLLKRSAASELVSAIREVMRGRSYVTPLVTQGLISSLMQAERVKPADDLTSREREVLQLLADGRSMKEIGALLDITPRTVAFHKYKLMEHLGVKSTAELIRYAVEHHLV